MIRVDLSRLPLISNDKYIPLFANTTRFLVMKGGAGSGKSYWAADKLIYRCLVEQDAVMPHRFLVCRKVKTTIRESCFELVKKRIAYMGFAKLFKYNETNMTIKCRNGNAIIFSGLDDVEKLKSIFDITGIWVEEASELQANDLRQLNIRLRGKRPYYKQILITFNPISYSNYLRPEFFTDPPRKDTLIVNSTYKDNKFIDEEYKEQLEAYKETAPYYYQVYVLNEWGSSEGACFPEFINKPDNPDRKWTHVIRPFKVPDSWRILRSFDFGYSKPFSCAWWAVDYDGRLYRIHELYGCTGVPDVGVKWTVPQIASRIAETEASHPLLKGKKIHGVADPSIWDESRGDSVGRQLEKSGIYFDPADNKRIAGKMQVHYRLAFDEEGYPMMYFFDNCQGIIRTLPELTYGDRDPEDVNTKLEDHCLIGDTLVWTEHGKTPIRELVGQKARVYGHDGQLHDMYDCRMTQKQAEVFTVELEDGTMVTATANHRFMLASGEWKRLDELQEGDDIKTIEEVHDGSY